MIICEDDDDEVVRYLSSYIVDHQDDFLVRIYDGHIILDRDLLEKTIKEFYESLP